ncbi:MAG: hypothetical protein Q4D54_01690 [Eubacteriales bacterium]|nr:hypothetical protein [Eubacteriales bacterium]
MKKIDRKITRMVLVGTVVTMMVSGCGKKSSVEDDFKEVLGTKTDAAGDEGNQNFDYEIRTNSGTAKIHFDVVEWMQSEAKIIPAKEIEVDEEYITSYAKNLFDNGEYTIVDGENEQTSEQVITQQPYGSGEEEGFMQVCIMQGKIDGKGYTINYRETMEGVEKGYRDIFLYRTEWENENQEELTYFEYSDEMCPQNVCDLSESMEIAEGILRKMGFEDYECVYHANLVDTAATDTSLGNGYSLFYRKKIEKTIGDCGYENTIYKINDEISHYEYISICVTEDGMISADFNDRYVMDEGQAMETGLQGMEELLQQGADMVENLINQYPDNEIVKEDGQDGEYNVEVKIVYLPIAYGEEIAYMPACMFFMKSTMSDGKKCIGAISAVDGMPLVVNYFFDPNMDSVLSGVG